MTVYEMLKTIGLPVDYGTNTANNSLPYLIYLGAGQDTFPADDTVYIKQNRYTVEYYFKSKSPETEDLIEQTFLDNGYYYSKSEDIYIASEKCFAIYYNI